MESASNFEQVQSLTATRLSYCAGSNRDALPLKHSAKNESSAHKYLDLQVR